MRLTRLKRLKLNRQHTKLITIILIGILIFNNIPINIFADTFQDEVTAVTTFMQSQSIKVPSDLIEAYCRVVKYDMNLDLRNRKLMWFNVGVYHKYRVVVYGKMNGSTDRHGEYRYLGYDILGDPVSNDDYENDIPYDPTNFVERDWQTVTGALDSWTSKPKIEAQRQRILTLEPIINDKDLFFMSLTEVLARVTTSDEQKENYIKNYIKIQTAPTLASNGSVRLERKYKGSRYYNTFIIPKYPFDPTVTVTTNKESYVINEAENTITTTVTVTANLAVPTELGLSPAQAIDKVSLSFDGDIKPATINGTTASVDFTKTFTRTGSGLSVGMNNVKLTGYIAEATSILGDKWNNIAGYKDITIDMKAAAVPFLNGNAVADPGSVEYADMDVPVKVTVSGAVDGISTADISRWQFFARKAEDAVAKDLVVNTSSVSAEASFNFTIPKSVMTGDYYKQDFVTRVRLYKRDNTYIDVVPTCYTEIFKGEPPVTTPGNIPPKARFRIPRVVKAGDIVEFDGSNSSDEDGYIVNYLWTTPGTADVVDDSIDDSWYPLPGDFRVKLKVTDDGGSSDSEDKNIKVIEPTPVAKIKYTGTLKENRKFTLINNNSISPVHYPLIAAKKRFNITGGNILNIKYPGSLAGVDSADYLIKAANNYTGSLYVENTAGYNNTAQIPLPIAPDKVPIANFMTVNTVVRCRYDSGYATITIRDTSYSEDNDYIGNLIYQVYYDSDNDGGFENGYMTIDMSTYADGETKTISAPWGEQLLAVAHKPAGKAWSVDVKTKSVGDYKIECTAIEAFGQETIPAFVVPTDYKRDDTSDKPIIEKNVEVINLAPYAAFGITEKRKVDIRIAVANSDAAHLNSVNTKINAILKPIMAAKNIDVNVTATSEMVATGSIPINKFYFSDNSNYDIKYYDEAADRVFTALVTNARYMAMSPKGFLYYQNYDDSNKGLYMFNPSTNTASSLGSIGTTVKNICFSADGNIVYYTSDSGLCAYNTITRVHSLILSGTILETAISRDGIIYMRDNYQTNPRVRAYNTNTGALYTVTKMTGAVNSMVVLNSGKVAYGINVGTTYALIVYDPITDTKNAYNTFEGYKIDSPVHALVTDGATVYFEADDMNNNDYMWSYNPETGVGDKINSWHSPRAYTTFGAFVSYRTTQGGYYNGDYVGAGMQPNLIHYPIEAIPPLIPKEVNDILSALTWRENSEKYFVALNGAAQSEFNNPQKLGGILQNLMTNNVSFVGIGSNSNKAHLENFIAKIDGNGRFIGMSNLDTALTELGNYIADKIVVDLVVNYNQSDHPLSTIQNKMNTLVKPKLTAANISANISYKTGASDLRSALSTTVWNPKNDHMFIHVQDSLLTELNDNKAHTAILDLLKAAEADIIGLITPTNASQIYNKLVLANDSQGASIDNSMIDGAMDSMANYIIANARKRNPNVYNYVLLGDTVNYNTTYEDPENDPKYAERWKFTHQYTYFDNNLGKIADSGQYRALPYTTFDKVGKFDITFGVRDNPKPDNLFDNYRLWSEDSSSIQTLYVHRKPNAIFASNIKYETSTGKFFVSYSESSEDLDHASRADRGIVRKQWQWKKVDDANWQLGAPTEIQKGIVYLVQLTVQDLEGVWSDPNIQVVEVPSLIVEADPSLRDWSNTDVDVNINVVRTGAATLQRVDYKWATDKIKPSTGWLSNTSYNFNVLQIATSEWYLHLNAIDNIGVNYYSFKGPYRIDKIAPTITADKNNIESNEPVTVNVEVNDTGGSGIKQVMYCWSKLTAKPTSGWTMTVDNFDATQEGEGTWYLHVEASDNAGNVTYGYLGSYTINTYKLENFRVVMVRDLHLEEFYRNTIRTLGSPFYIEKPMYVNDLAIDAANFGPVINGLAKGYRFEFKIDSVNFNENLDTIVIKPHFYTADALSRDTAERDLYWEDSNHHVYKAGEGGHEAWESITLTKENRAIINQTRATWKGDYLIPATAWAVPINTLENEAKDRNLEKDIIVNFEIKGYKAGIMKFDYNLLQWGLERTISKYPYQIGDVIRYSWNKSCLEDINIKDNR